MRIKVSIPERIFRAFNYCILACLSFVCFYPLWHVAMASLTSSNALLGHSGLMFLPPKFSWESYIAVLNHSQLWVAYKNTIIYVVEVTAVQMVVTCMGAYFFARRALFRRPLMLMVMFTMYFGGGMVPFYLTLRDFGLLDTKLVMIIPFAISTYNMIILRTAFESLPASLLEAAEIDGASQMGIMWRICIPLSKASLAVICLYYAVGSWNSYFWADILINDRNQRLLQPVLRDLLVENMMEGIDSGMSTNEGVKYACIMAATIPILMVYPYLQKYFTKGVMIGAVKE